MVEEEDACRLALTAAKELLEEKCGQVSREDCKAALEASSELILDKCILPKSGNPNAVKHCIASESCTAETPYGVVQGKKCPIGDEAYHNTIVDRSIEILESGVLKTGQHPGALGQEVVSLSSCPTQGYGGNVKFILKNGKEVRPMCYYEYEPHKEVDRGIEKEAREDIDGMKGSNRVRAKYGVNFEMYRNECEYVSDKNIPLKPNLKKIEFWIPWRIEKFSFSHRCRGSHPGYANVGGYFSGVKLLQEQIKRVKDAAEKAGVPFEVKSCFAALKTGWGDQHIPLNKANLEKLADGELPAIVKGKIPEKCTC